MRLMDIYKGRHSGPQIWTHNKTSLLWQESQKQWKIEDEQSKRSLSVNLQPTESGEKAFHLYTLYSNHTCIQVKQLLFILYR
jgi:hypothetical protein